MLWWAVTLQGNTAFAQLPAAVQQPHVRFESISIEQGLSQSSVQAVVQDQRGFLWIGTKDGLNRYDGYAFEVFRSVRGDSFSLSSSRIEALLVDQDGDIWVGTNDGLNVFSYRSRGFKRFYYQPNNSNSLSNNSITSLFQDKSGVIWIGTQKGLNSYNKKTGAFSRYLAAKDNPTTISHDYVYTIYEDKLQQLWVGTRGGLNRMNRDTKTFVNYARVSDATTSPVLTLSFNEVFCLVGDDNGTLWVGTGSGLYKFDRATELFQNAENTLMATGNLIQKQVNALCRSTEGNLWIGTENEGLKYYNVKTGEFTIYRHDVGDPESLGRNQVSCLLVARSGILWVGLQGAGLNKYDPQIQQFVTIRSSPRPDALSSNYVTAIYDEENGPMWIGTSEGLNMYDKTTGKFKLFRHNPADQLTLGDDNVYCILRASDSTLWVGTDRGVSRLNPDGSFSNLNLPALAPNGNQVRTLCEGEKGVLWIGTYAGGMSKFNIADFATASFDTVYRASLLPDANAIQSNRIYKILLDPADSTLWIGTQSGLTHFNPRTNVFKNYVHDPQNSLSGPDAVYSVCRDLKGDIWMTSYGTGICRFDRKEEKFYYFTAKEGLINQGTYCILADRDSSIWVSHNQGLSQLSSNGTFHNYDVADGLQSNEFNTGACFQNAKGQLFFGGIKGLNIFDPSKIQRNMYIPPVVLTAFKKFDRKVEFDRDISEMEAIELKHTDNYIAFEFAALNFTSPEKNRYAYKLEPFDEDWIYSDDRRYASYTNLDPGKYTFRVKASNNDNFWNEVGATMQLVIPPPFYRTGWFRGLTLSGLVVMVILGYGVRIQRIQAQKRKLEGLVEARTRELHLKNQQVLEQSAQIKREKQRTDQINEELAMTVEEVKQKNLEIEDKNNKILDSIYYAQRIQRSILPARQRLSSHFPESFVFFKPKDIVSGDFYWFTEKNDHLLVAAIDCTGHGVPGAFMSLIGYSQLNKIVDEMGIVEPTEILKRLDEAVLNVLQQNGRQARDGMDVALCSFHRPSGKLRFAGAHRPLWIVRDGELIEIAADRCGVGIGQLALNSPKQFTPYEIDLEKGDMIYLFSDGFTDQFGGGSDRKYMVKRFKKFLSSLAHLPADAQYHALGEEFRSWMGGSPQIDDVLVIGMRMTEPGLKITPLQHKALSGMKREVPLRRL
ncbi:two-component regulator propeller domain-containing protein [Catalinimonas alkaloidigena]|uniref:two-component regulator propeller domain-containing protein n=1 Tax=Catalinimonas alkaloidigena TaxID=1075417 RepID=UPI001C40B0EB|nr:two-component regulator propeller domain-containing protein [Catalinimonas alkaloidigena]